MLEIKMLVKWYSGPLLAKSWIGHKTRGNWSNTAYWLSCISTTLLFLPRQRQIETKPFSPTTVFSTEPRTGKVLCVTSQLTLQCHFIPHRFTSFGHVHKMLSSRLPGTCKCPYQVKSQYLQHFHHSSSFARRWSRQTSPRGRPQSRSRWRSRSWGGRTLIARTAQPHLPTCSWPGQSSWKETRISFLWANMLVQLTNRVPAAVKAWNLRRRR